MRHTGFIILALLGTLVVALMATRRLVDEPLLVGTPSLELSASAPEVQRPATPEPLSGSARVIDGDTIMIAGKRIRLFGIDAPEKRQPCSAGERVMECGYEASEALTRLIGAATISCDPRAYDRYGRVVAVCSIDGRDIAREMVASGWAVAFERYSRDYVADEAAARSARVGIWQGTFVRPEQWRAKLRASN